MGFPSGATECERLGWGNVSLPPPPEKSPLAAMSVKAATSMQLGPRLAAQLAARVEYVACALAAGAAPPPPATVHAATKHLGAAMSALWRLDWDNRRRETLWRLTLNGVAAAGGHGLALKGPCKCGWDGPPAEAADAAQ